MVKCNDTECKKRACFGILGEKPLHCKEHKKENLL